MRTYHSSRRSRFLFAMTGGMAAMLLVAVQPAQAGDNNLHFDGSLVAEPCELDPSTTDIEVDFGTVIDKYLYLNTRTHNQSFTVNLVGCDSSLANQVTMTFKGAESQELPGLLAMSGGTATGIAIGMELADGTPLPFNQQTPKFDLQDGTNSLAFSGYVQGEPSALQNHSIGRGDFTATATFELDYP